MEGRRVENTAHDFFQNLIFLDKYCDVMVVIKGILIKTQGWCVNLICIQFICDIGLYALFFVRQAPYTVVPCLSLTLQHGPSQLVNCPLKGGGTPSPETLLGPLSKSEFELIFSENTLQYKFISLEIKGEKLIKRVSKMCLPHRSR